MIKIVRGEYNFIVNENQNFILIKFEQTEEFIEKLTKIKNDKNLKSIIF